MTDTTKKNQEANDRPEPEQETETTEHDSDSKERADDVITLPEPSLPFPVVGIGASAGGLAALEELFEAMPADSGMAFVVVMHLMPSQESNLAGLLQKHSQMKVAQIKDGMAVEPDRVYVIPPNHELGILNGSFQLLKLAEKEPRMGIDTFLRHLAREQGPSAICIILSGSGSDGTLGLKAISEASGLVMAQEPETADYGSMPRSAIETGLVDFVLPPADMPEALLTYLAQARDKITETKVDPQSEAELKKVFLLLRTETGQDFSQYRINTLFRRISKRMAVHGLDSVGEYVDFVRQNPEELDSLYQEILIGVTQFFREPEAFEIVKEKVLPELIDDRSEVRPLRVWVPGCSTGEEAYSLALLIYEYKQQVRPNLKVDIFASDVNPVAIAKARLGKYPDSIAADLPESYLERYFTRQDHACQLKPQIREMVIFAEQNLLNDPPFSKLDLISCRNLLIYMKTKTQQKALALFQYALKPDGFLLLGSSENVGDFSDYFEVVDRKWRLFRRTDSLVIPPADVDFFNVASHAPPDAASEAGTGRGSQPPVQPQMLEKSLLAHYEPVGIMINADYDILYTYGQIDQYLKLVPGEARLNIMEMLRAGLDMRLAGAIRYAVARTQEVSHRRVWVKTNGAEKYVDYTVKPVGDAAGRDLFLIIIEERVSAETDETDEAAKIGAEFAAPASDPEADPEIQDLIRELAQTKQRLQHTIEELQVVNEEHRSYAEELQSANEELQSINEELTTSQEELQSVNEELVTANAEIQRKNRELRQTNNDLHNLLGATEIATIFLDTELKIKRFVPAATRILNLIEGDVGRPLKHVVSNLRDEWLNEDAEYVLDTLNTVEKEVQTEAGEWYNMRISPYRTVENVIEGVVLTFAEIGAQKGVEAGLRRARDYAREIIDTLHEGVLILDEELRILSANRSFYRQFQFSPAETEGQLIYELGERQWDIPELRELLEEIIPADQVVEQFELEHEFRHLGRKRMRLNARRLAQPEGDEDRILLAIEDITEQA